MKTGIIYKATNTITGKSYIGQTTRGFEKRKQGHKSKALNSDGFLFHKSIREYGFSNFKWCIVDSNIPKGNELDDMEFHYIKQYNTLMPNGYNMTMETSGNLGFDFSGKNNPRYGDHRTYIEIHGKEKAEKLKKEKSIKSKELWKNPEYRKKIKTLITSENNPMNNEESRKKLSITKTGGNNPMAKYNYRFILPDGKIYKTDCLSKFCRDNNFKICILTKICSVKNYKSKNPFYHGWKGEKMLKENKI